MIPIPATMMQPLLKIGGVLLAVILIYGLGQWHGREAIQEAWDAEVMNQQLRTGEFIVQQGTEHVRAAKVHQDQLRHLADANRRLTQKVRSYEAHTEQCELSLEFERTFDAVSRMRDAGPDGLSAAADTTRVAGAADPAPLTDAAILPAYQGAVAQLYACTDQLNTLIDWEAKAREIAAVGAGR